MIFQAGPVVSTEGTLPPTAWAVAGNANEAAATNTVRKARGSFFEMCMLLAPPVALLGPLLCFDFDAFGFLLDVAPLAFDRLCRGLLRRGGRGRRFGRRVAQARERCARGRRQGRGHVWWALADRAFTGHSGRRRRFSRSRHARVIHVIPTVGIAGG